MRLSVKWFTQIRWVAGVLLFEQDKGSLLLAREVFYACYSLVKRLLKYSVSDFFTVFL